MATKENKGGLLTNEQVERDLESKGRTENQNGYAGAQDTGDDGVRQMGDAVQQRDGQPEGEADKGK